MHSLYEKMMPAIQKAQFIKSEIYNNLNMTYQGFINFGITFSSENIVAVFISAR
jgi:hypothetical protein